MNVNSVLGQFFRPRLLPEQAPGELPFSKQPILPITAADELPARDEKLTILYGRRPRILDPNWALVPKDR